MNKDEMIKEIKAIIVKHHYGLGCEHNCNGDQCENCDFTAEDIYNAGYRKIEDDEIVLKKSEYKELKKYRTDWLNDEKMHLQAELEDTEFELGCSNRLFQKVCKEKKELEEQLEQAKRETRTILQELKALFGTSREFNWSDKGTAWESGSIGSLISDKIEKFAKDKGIKLED